MKITKTQLKQIIKEELSNILEGNFEERYNLEKDARDVGIPEEDIKNMSDAELIAAIHSAMDNVPKPRMF